MPFVFPNSGRVKETFRSETALSFEWTDPVLMSRLDEDGDAYMCSFVPFLGTRWTVMVYPNGEPGPESKTKGWLAIALVKEDLELPNPVRFTLGIKSKKGTEDVALRPRRYPANSLTSPLAKLVSQSDLLRRRSQLAPSGILTIACTIESEKPDCTGGSSEESDDSASESESVEEESGVAEKDGEHSEDEGWATFRKNFKDKARLPDDLSTRRAMELYRAGDQQDFPELKKMCVLFLTTSLSKEGICDVIVFAKEHGEDALQEIATKFFVRNAIKIIKTQEFRRLVRSHSDVAYDLYVKSFEANCVKKE